VTEDAPFSWDEVEVGQDDRTLTLRAIHSPPVWSAPDVWFRFGRAQVSYEARAVRVLLLLEECGADEPGAYLADDPAREVEVVLDEPLAGRVPVDGGYRFVEPEGAGRGRSEAVQPIKVQQAPPSSLVVYWLGGMAPLDRIDVDERDDAVVLKVWEQPVGKLAGVSKAARVDLARPLGERWLLDGTPSK
jgi:hypothetical protein